MKKAFALVLAVAMVMSLAAVSFATTIYSETDKFGANKGAKVEDCTIGLVGPYKYGADDDKFTTVAFEYGKPVYYLITVTDTKTSAFPDESVLSDYKDVEKLKVKAKWEMGADLVESVSIVKKSYAAAKSAPSLVAAMNGADDGYYYFLEVKTKAKTSTSDADVIGTLTFNKKANDESNWHVDDCDFDISFNQFYEKNYRGTTKDSGMDVVTVANDLKVTGDNVEIKWDDNYLLKFDYDDETEFNFGYNDLNEGTFTVDVSGQGKILMKYNTKADEAVADANPGVVMHFVNFNNTKFNRTGEFEYELEDAAAAYMVVDGKLVAIPGCEIEDDTITFKTRVLGNYVFATAELAQPAVAPAAAAEAPVAATNPTTGAAA